MPRAYPNCERRAYTDGLKVQILECQKETPAWPEEPAWRVSVYKAPYNFSGGPADLPWLTLGQYQTAEIAWDRLVAQSLALQNNGWHRWYLGPDWTSFVAWDVEPIRLANSRRTYMPSDITEPEPIPTGPIVCQRVPLETHNRRKIIELIWLSQVQHWQIRAHTGYAHAVRHGGFASMSTSIIAEPTEEDDARQAFHNIVVFHLNSSRPRWTRWENRPTWVMPIFEFQNPWDETAHRAADWMWIATGHKSLPARPDDPEALAKVRADLVSILQARAAQEPAPEPLSHWDRLEL